MTYQIITGNSARVLKTYPDNYFDSVVCDPPYGINFLGKDWDSNTGEEEVYRECLRVLKPGGHLLAFSAARTYHHLAMTIERAGFEVRDQIMWVYGSGFPKSQDVGRQIQKGLGVKKTTTIKTHDIKSNALLEKKGTAEMEQVVCTDPEAKAWEGWGTSLKPAHEPICLARKPVKQSIAKNVQQWGTGALNIDATRIPEQDQEQERFPSNVIGRIQEPYQKYFYCPKVSKSERNVGCDDFEPAQMTNKKGNGIQRICETCGTPQMKASECLCPTKSWVMPTVTGNNHPTVKPIALMEYLIKLVTPAGGHVLDPFNGSGSTGCAAVGLGYRYTGIELDPRYVDIANQRIAAWLKQQQPLADNPLFEEKP